MTRDQSIDIAKGIGIITVVWGHMDNACPVKEEIYLFHMPLFFLLSGYFFNLKKDNSLTEIIGKKINSYIIPYILFFIINIFIFIALYALTGRTESIHIYPRILIYPYGVVRPLWFLISLFEVSIFYLFIHSIFKKEHLISFIILLLYICGVFLFVFDIHLPLFLDASLSMLLFFHIGYLLHKYQIFNLAIINKVLITIIGLSFYIIAVRKHLNVDIMINNLSSNVFLFTFSALGISVVILYISQLLSKTSHISKLFAFLGRKSLVIFALHILCFELARTFFGFPVLEESTYLDGTLMTILGIIGSLLLGYPIEKYILPVFTKKWFK